MQKLQNSASATSLNEDEAARSWSTLQTMATVPHGECLRAKRWASGSLSLEDQVDSSRRSKCLTSLHFLIFEPLLCCAGK